MGWDSDSSKKILNDILEAKAKMVKMCNHTWVVEDGWLKLCTKCNAATIQDIIEYKSGENCAF